MVIVKQSLDGSLEAVCRCLINVPSGGEQSIMEKKLKRSERLLPGDEVSPHAGKQIRRTNYLFRNIIT